MFEHRSTPVLPLVAFLGRLARFALFSTAIVAFSLALGSSGYHRFGGLPWIDAFLNASMILTGMGPVDRMETAAGKLFAAGYALYSGIAFLTATGVLLAPAVHRFFHRLHVEIADPFEDEGAAEPR